MLKTYENKMLRINKQVKGFPAGSRIPVRVDENGVIVNRTLRKKLKDAEIDGCVSLEEQTKPKTKTKKK